MYLKVHYILLLLVKDDFFEKLDEYINRLEACKGRFIINPLNKLADKLAMDMAKLGDLTDDDDLWDVSKRAIINAWKAGCIMWVLNGQTWTRSMGEIVEWLVYHDLWSKMQVFADLIDSETGTLTEAQRHGPKNFLDDLPSSFNEAELQALRNSLGKSPDGTKNQLRAWKRRGYIEFSPETGLYSKTGKYLHS